MNFVYIILSIVGMRNVMPAMVFYPEKLLNFR